MDKEQENLFINIFAKYPKKLWFSPKEVGDILGYSDQFVRNAYFSGKIQGLCSNGSARRGEEKKTYIRIHRISIIAYLLQESNFDSKSFTEGMRQLFSCCSKYHLFLLQKMINEQIQKALP